MGMIPRVHVLHSQNAVVSKGSAGSHSGVQLIKMYYLPYGVTGPHKPPVVSYCLTGHMQEDTQFFFVHYTHSRFDTSTLNATVCEILQGLTVCSLTKHRRRSLPRTLCGSLKKTRTSSSPSLRPLERNLLRSREGSSLLDLLIVVDSCNQQLCLSLSSRGRAVSRCFSRGPHRWNSTELIETRWRSSGGCGDTHVCSTSSLLAVPLLYSLPPCTR